MSPAPRKPRYFPVKPEPLRMQAGLLRFGTDFGNGEVDTRFFPVDEDAPRYLGEKARVLGRYPRRCSISGGGRERAALAHVLGWMHATLATERGHLLGVPSRGALEADFDAIAREVAEDFVVLERGEGSAGRAILVHVCFPSGWEVERIAGRSFLEIHEPVPEFAAVARSGTMLVDAMVERGPYVRFVWTISADDALDHHPREGRREPWTADTRPGFLRVERQTTVPFPEVNASLFLIRTYLYRFDELGSEGRQILATALGCMPPVLLEYKGLAEALPRALALLRQGAGGSSE